jgi:hypothetical protein
MIAEIYAYLNHLGQRLRPRPAPPRSDLVAGARPLPLMLPLESLPAWVTACPVARKYHALLQPLDWAAFPERPTDRPWPGPTPAPRAPFVAAFLVKLHDQQRYMSDLRTFLIDHPALVWLLGFPLVLDPTAPHGFTVAATVPTRRQFSRVLRTLPNDALQFLLTSSIGRITETLSPEQQAAFGQTVAGDTKHILAWVKENNPKVYVEHRFDKHRQPSGDPDCKLGVKKQRNRTTAAEQGLDADAFPTPTSDAQPASHARVEKDAYWGYASGIIATILPDGLGEVVLAERTRPFNESDPSYFFPLMTRTEQVLGFRPPYGAFDAGFDAFYVYAYFHEAGGLAAVPLVARRGTAARRFSPDGVPLCQAGLPMPCTFTYTDRTSTLVVHERGKHGCPLLHPTPTGDTCPIDDPHWAKGGCTTTIATSIGARIRIELDRESAQYQAIYRQRTVTERLNSQAVELGIERPKLRNGRAITNQNTLLYVLLNLRTLQRMQPRQAALACPEVAPAGTA